MENNSHPQVEQPAPGWAVAAILSLFLAPGILGLIRLPLYLQISGWVTIIIVVLLLFVPMGIGVYMGLPRWSLVYFGMLTGFAGVYVFSAILGFFMFFPSVLGHLFESQILSLTNQGIAGENMASQLLQEWYNQGRFWLGIVFANGVLVGLAALIPWSKTRLRILWEDLTQLSFLFYGAILIIFFIDFDEYQFEQLYVLSCLASLALGAWGYLRARTPGRRTLALLAGLTGCMLIMGVSKYFLVPLQNWGDWFDQNAKDSQRWFESLRTIATWFWCALAVGLPGLIQMLRKSLPAVPQEIPQTV